MSPAGGAGRNCLRRSALQPFSPAQRFGATDTGLVLGFGALQDAQRVVDGEDADQAGLVVDDRKRQ